MTQLTVTAKIYAPIETVREKRTNPIHVTQRNAASDDRHCPSATGDLKVGGQFSYTMAARDGSFSFDFTGTYTDIKPMSLISYVMGDMPSHDVPEGRKVSIFFDELSCGSVQVTETFDAEELHSLEQQQQGRQAILDRFKGYVESGGEKIL